MNKGPEILVMYGGGLANHLVKIQEELAKLSVKSVFDNYRGLWFKTGFDNKKPKIYINEHDLKQFKVIFFRGIGRRWEAANLIVNYLKEEIESGKIRVVDPLVTKGQPFISMKAMQMFVFQEHGLSVPKTLYGRLYYLKKHAPEIIGFPMIIKRSEGGRGQRVFLVKTILELERLISEIYLQEREEKKKFLAQEFIENQGDLRILVLGDKVLGAMERFRVAKGEFRNNASLGGQVRLAELSPKIAAMAVKAAQLTGHGLAGVDIVLRSPDGAPFLFEVNRGPQFKGLMRATGINVPAEIAKYLVELRNQVS